MGFLDIIEDILVPELIPARHLRESIQRLFGGHPHQQVAGLQPRSGSIRSFMAPMVRPHRDHSHPGFPAARAGCSKERTRRARPTSKPAVPWRLPMRNWPRS